jgi:23S rRNA (guanosine2251-2'-O)-methyltransferase
VCTKIYYSFRPAPNLNGKVSVHQHSNLVYGIHAVEGLLERGARRIERVYFDAGRQSRSGPLFAIRKRCRRLRITTQNLPSARLRQVCGSDKHQGVAALCAVKEYADVEEIFNRLQPVSAPLFLVPASIEDPGNLGTIIRSAAAFGVDALFLERKNTVALNAAVAKSAVGMLERVAVARPRNLEGLLGELRDRGYAIIGASAEATRRPDQVELAGPTVLIVGGEHRDLPPYLLKSCSRLVGIPTAAATTSLNVSAATAVMLYECSRQRGFHFGQL